MDGWQISQHGNTTALNICINTVCQSNKQLFQAGNVLHSLPSANSLLIYGISWVLSAYLGLIKKLVQTSVLRSYCYELDESHGS